MCSSCARWIGIGSQRRKRVIGCTHEILSNISCILISDAVEQPTIFRATRSRVEETLLGVTGLMKVNKISSHGLKYSTSLILQEEYDSREKNIGKR